MGLERWLCRGLNYVAKAAVPKFAFVRVAPVNVLFGHDPVNVSDNLIDCFKARMVGRDKFVIRSGLHS